MLRTDATLVESTVHSWNCPPEAVGARYAIVLPSGEKTGDATSRPLTRVRGAPAARAAGSKVATSRSAAWLEPLLQTIAICFSSGDKAGCAQSSSGEVRAWPGEPARV